MAVDENSILEALNFGDLSEAEKITGKSYKNDEPTSDLGLTFHLAGTKAKKEILIQSDDTYFHIPVDDYLRIVNELGFELALKEDFSVAYSAADIVHESYYIFWHPAGVLLDFDTYSNQTVVNGASFYYNWRPIPDCNPHKYTSSGCFHRVGHNNPARESLDALNDDYDWEEESRKTELAWEQARKNGELIWVGDHDCREGLRFHFDQLRQNGQFVNPWIQAPFFRLVHWGDTKTIDTSKGIGEYSKMADAKTAERIAKLPDHVRRAIILPLEITNA